MNSCHSFDIVFGPAWFVPLQGWWVLSDFNLTGHVLDAWRLTNTSADKNSINESTHSNAPPLSAIDRCIEKAIGNRAVRATMMTMRAAIATAPRMTLRRIENHTRHQEKWNSETLSSSTSLLSRASTWSLAAIRLVTLHLLFFAQLISLTVPCRPIP